MFAYMYYSIGTIKKDLNSNIDKLVINLTRDFVHNIDKKIKEKVEKGSIVKLLHANSELRYSVENIISTISTDSLRYVYILYRNTDGVYKYLVDGSYEDRGELDQPLNVNKKEWNKVYNTKKDIIFYQKDIKTLWTTYLHPIIYKDKVEAVLAIDFSFDLKNRIKKVIKPLDIYFIFIFLAIFVLILVFLIELYLNHKIKLESYTDSLTQIYNRHYLRIFLDKVNIDNYQIMMIDIDYFKKVNDSYGHEAGDAILKGFAHLTKQAIRENDVLFRYGGEEFLIFIENKNNIDIGEQIARRIKNKAEETKFIWGTQEIKITVSIGLNRYPENFKSIDQAINYADEMLYLAKKDGRNCIRSKKIHQDTSCKLSISEIKEAFDDKRIKRLTCWEWIEE